MVSLVHFHTKFSGAHNGSKWGARKLVDGRWVYHGYVVTKTVNQNRSTISMRKYRKGILHGFSLYQCKTGESTITRMKMYTRGEYRLVVQIIAAGDVATVTITGGGNRIVGVMPAETDHPDNIEYYAGLHRDIVESALAQVNGWCQGTA